MIFHQAQATLLLQFAPTCINEQTVWGVIGLLPVGYNRTINR
jgi:hypothetical protein